MLKIKEANKLIKFDLMPLRIFIICLVLVSCSSSRMIETSLYFGQTRPNGSMISETEWNDFKESQISRVFKEGSTTIKVTGSWYDPEAYKLITEPTNVVIYYYKKSAYISKQIDSLRNLYKSMFQQQSILRVDKKVKGSF